MSSVSSSLQQAWLNQASELLTPFYKQPHRRYHGLAHIQNLLRMLEKHEALTHDKLSVGLAIWFHDAIYDTARQDNEEQSAILCEQTLQSWCCPQVLIDSVVRKIRATQHHAWTDADPDTALFLDFDLGILAAPPAAYQRYADQIAQEYDWVPQQAYRLGRAKVLRSFLDRPQLYFTPLLRASWEPLARANLLNELNTLS